MTPKPRTPLWMRLDREPASVAGALLVLLGLVILGAAISAVVFLTVSVVEAAGPDQRGGVAFLYLGFTLPAAVLGVLAGRRGWSLLREPGTDPVAARGLFLGVGLLGAVALAATGVGGWGADQTGGAVFLATLVATGLAATYVPSR